MSTDEREAKARDHRAIWKILPREVKFAMLALGLVTIDEHTGAPILDDAAMTMALQVQARQAAAEAEAP